PCGGGEEGEEWWVDVGGPQRRVRERMVKEWGIQGLAVSDGAARRQVGIEVLVMRAALDQHQGIEDERRTDQRGLGDEGRSNLPDGRGGRCGRGREGRRRHCP